MLTILIAWYYKIQKLNVTVNSEIFERVLFSRKTLKDIFARLKNRDYGMIYLYQSIKRHDDFANLRGFYFHAASHMRSFAKINPREHFRTYSI